MSSNLDYPMRASSAESVDADELWQMADLQEWMQNRIEKYEREVPKFDRATPQGRTYVARTIQYQSGVGLCQTGSAPSFFGGVWSLATCKKYMRGEPTRGDPANPDHPFQKLFRKRDEDGIRRPKYPVFILTCASRNRAHDKPVYVDSHRNWLASIAMVTHGFDRMEDYGWYLRQTFNGEAVRHRLTHASNPTPLAENRGDCHIDDTGVVRYPPAGHQHGGGKVEAECGCDGLVARQSKEHIDNSENHIKCVSKPGYWRGWTNPQFALKSNEEITRGHRTTEGFCNIIEQFEPINEP